MDMKYRVIRSDRRTISLSISDAGEVVIRAPVHCPDAYIESFAREKWGWVEKHMPAVQACLADRAAFTLQPGMTLPVLGQERPVEASPDGKTAWKEGTWLVPDLPFEELKPQIISLYRKLGAAWLPPRVQMRAREMGVTYGRITVNHASRRWASCSASGNLQFSWRLIMAPPEAIDYVIVHELSHRRYFDHSPEFWALVSCYCPDWKAQKEQLNQLHQRLLHENWV